MVNAPAELIKVLNATVSTIRCASVSAWDDWGVIVNEPIKMEAIPGTQKQQEICRKSSVSNPHP